MRKAAHQARSIKVTADGPVPTQRCVPEEVPVALVYDGSTHAVMMASPTDLEAFALGFSLSERIVVDPNEIQNMEVIDQGGGIELRMWLSPGRSRALAERRRSLAGPTGCGLCGIESLEAAVQACPRVTSELTVSAKDIQSALATLIPAQRLNQQTHAVHGAGYWTRTDGLVALTEDVGRHNALDKLIGKLRKADISVGEGIVLLTSRVSVEMVQKAAIANVPVVVAISAPTALALKTAEEAGITLIAVARSDGFEVFTHPHRVAGLDTVQAKKSAIEYAA